MSGNHRESTIIHLEEVSPDSSELHFPAGSSFLSSSYSNLLGLKPFENIPRTEDNADVDYYAVLAIKPDVFIGFAASYFLGFRK